MTDDALPASHAYCHAQTKAHARSFHFASVALPRERRRAAYAVYAFCRYADDLADRNQAGDALVRIGEEFDRLTGEAREPAFAPAFAWAVQRYGIPKSYFLELLEGVSGDLGTVRIADWPQLRLYSYRVASVVGLMMSKIFEVSDEAVLERAIELGLAMQLTNIIRDVGEDYRLGRIYLPADELAAAGVAEADLGAPSASPALKALLRSHAERAKGYYHSAEAGIPSLPDDGSQLTVWLMRHVYAGILEEAARADYDVLRKRAATSAGRKCLLALRAWRDYRRTRAGG